MGKLFAIKLALPKWRIVFPEGGPLSDMGIELLRSLLTCCPERRISAEAASEDPYFWERPYAVDPGMMSSFQDTNSSAHERRPVVRRSAVAAPATARSLAIGSTAAIVTAASGGVPTSSLA